ncbi:probable glycosyltransferase At3g07620 [Vicia villosa]|uniref:probable glycosyltransferase At3g07620 n=1 Tax=Vicia villosa TaxID=3911 RepID=UPI00273CAA69|nr:probable glycosyltransferase At3g07620 [Vicia villosa]
MLLLKTTLSLLLLSCSSSFVVSLPQNNPYLTSTTLFLQNYHKMVQNFKVFMYPPNTNQFDNFGTELESLFYSSLLNSSYLTQHPQQAHLFFFPFSSEISTRSLSRLISRIREDFPYWNRSLGADHFYLSCAGIPNKNDRNIVELKKNAVQISCFPTRRHRFVPHKDLTLPPISNLHAPGGGDFCLVEYGNDMGEAMRLGCVPVVVVTEGGVNDMPFMDVLRWKEMAVFVKSGVKNDTDTWKKRHDGMKRLGVEGCKHLRWNRPPQPLDAFNTIMYQLWLRRHTVRYENVDTSYTQAII